MYLYRNKNGKVIYVGKAKNLRDRVRSYFREGGKRREAKIIAIQKNAVDVETIVTNSEVEALILENNLIKEHRPRYNVLMKDDKTFPYICITKELLPRIFITRKIEKNGSQYFGPYTNAYALREMMKIVEKVFTVRSCNHRFTPEMLAEKKVKLCLDYHIKKCDGPCENLISPAEYAEMLTRLRKFLNGDSKPVVQFLQVEMKRASENLRFEDAARFRDQIQMAKNFYKKQQVELLDNRDRDVIALSRTTSDERRMSNGKGASKYEISNTQHSTLNIQHSTFNTQHSTLNTRESACITMLRLRQGKLLSRETVILPDVSGQSDAEILASFCGQFYLESDLIPKEINVQTQPKDAENLKIWLTEKRKSKVALLVPQKGDKKRLMEMAEKNAHLSLQSFLVKKLQSSGITPKSVSQLQKDLHLKNLPRRIECFDNSNLQGTNPVASMVVFLDGKPLKKSYRQFKIKTVSGIDDFASMREIFTRRYKRMIAENQQQPDLILVDGGKGQLSSAKQILDELGLKIPVFGLAKRLEEVFRSGKSEPMTIKKTSPGLFLLRKIRDEAHRFAIEFHRNLRSKKMVASELDELEGIGPHRKKILLDCFRTVSNLRSATAEDIAKVHGIGEITAQMIFEQMH